MLINIRKETENDCNDIKSVNDKAFGQENEGKLVKNLRKNEKYNSDLSLIAEVDNKIVGHILFFPIKVISQKNEYENLSLAPMSVLPNYQKMGIGSKLLKKPDMILLSYWVTLTITYPENHIYNFFF